ncbi:uncharacterized protein LOC122638575 [Telopea speciosissima]|uniref:uncharacterized protein LOC122638575 n=1 Tax=Telopea speciosissima TaxID=54955 RepID=UPI001CC34AC6|nr:uncharacterized protein LOC122638575 [Telopea speciosissima]
MMMPKAHAFFRFHCLHPLFFPISGFNSSTTTHTLKAWLCSTSSSSDKTLKQLVPEDPLDTPSAEILRNYGCNDSEISKIFMSQPLLRKAKPGILQLKLNVLHGLGFTSSDVVKLIRLRPRLLCCRIYSGIDERIEFLQSFFGSREVLFKAILKNPTLLKESLLDHLKRCTAIYEGFGITRKDLIPLLISRPTLITRTKLDDDEKLEYIRRTGVSKDSKMYKHVVSLIAISRVETIREKFANLANFGFSEDEVVHFFGRSPAVLTLSVDKVQRNMTFILGTMKLDASMVLYYPFLLFGNLETVLKPRVLLLEKIKAMGLVPQIKGPAMMSALRMTELRFLKKFVNCHDKDVSKTLLAFYEQVKCVKRLAQGSKRIKIRNFPF